jgi:hypothetical protein
MGDVEQEEDKEGGSDSMRNAEKNVLKEHWTTGARVMDGWKFNYLPWRMDLGSTVYRSGLTETKLFPDDQKGHLDYELQNKMRLSKRRILNGGVLFFFQLLLLICDPKKVRHSG